MTRTNGDIQRDLGKLSTQIEGLCRRLSKLEDRQDADRKQRDRELKELKQIVAGLREDMIVARGDRRVLYIMLAGAGSAGAALWETARNLFYFVK